MSSAFILEKTTPEAASRAPSGAIFLPNAVRGAWGRHVRSRSLRWAAVLAFAMSPVSGASGSPAEPMRLCFDPRFILQTVALHMKVTLRPEIPSPAIFLNSTTPLRQLQDAIESQWRFRPQAFVSAYVVARNEIYLYDNATYYVSRGRTLDDSLAHEFVHYLQTKYFNATLAELDEFEAVDIQTWFRKKYAQCNSSALQALTRDNPQRRQSSSKSAPG